MKRPLAMVALLFAGGILLGNVAGPPLAVLIGVSMAFGVVALAWERGRPVLLWGLPLLVGWSNEVARIAVVAPDDLRNLFGGGAEQVTVRGRIGAPVSQRLFVRDNTEGWRSTAVIVVDEIQRGTNWEPAYGRVSAGCPGLLDSNYFAGQEIIVRGVLQPPAGPQAPGLFDARQFYGEEGIYFQLRTESTNDWQTVPGGATWVGQLGGHFQIWARATLARGLPEEDEPLRLLWTLALDWRAPLTAEVAEPFLKAGTYHIFAVDGLRIGILTGICLAMLRVLRAPRAWCGAVALPLIWAYTALTGWPASAVRASIMMTIVVVGWALRRPTDLVNSLFAAAFIILCWDPRQLFQAGFQLSFVIVFCIGVLLPPARAYIYERVLRGDPFLPEHLRRRWPEWLWACIKYGVDLLLLSLTAWLASVPLAAYYFHLFTPWSVPANFIVVPLTALALTACLASLFFGAWLPALSVIFNHSAWFWMKAIIVVTGWWAGWRPSSIHVGSPDISLLAWYYLALLAVASGWIFRTRWKRPAWLAIAAASAWVAGHEIVEAQTTRLFVLPARGGSVVFIDKPSMLVDCGGERFADDVLKPFLQAQGVDRLGEFCLSSDHLEQVGGAGAVRSNFVVVQFSGVGGLRAGRAAAGWNVVHPAPGEKHPRADDDALVLGKEIGPWKILLLSRLGRSGQEALLRGAYALRSDVVVAGLPAQDEPLSEPLLDAIAPKIILIVDSTMPATRRATEALRDRLGRRGAKVFYCRDAGALTIETRGKQLRLRDASGQILLETD